MSPRRTPGNDTESTAKMLLDASTTTPALGYGEIGTALATIISQSEPRFTVGIFVGWGDLGG